MTIIESIDNGEEESEIILCFCGKVALIYIGDECPDCGDFLGSEC